METRAAEGRMDNAHVKEEEYLPPEELLDFFRDEKNRKFIVASHISPEGDAIGSTLALAAALRATGKDVIAYNKDNIPHIFHFLPGSEDISHTLPENFIDYALVLVDCSKPFRAALEGTSFRRTAVIDHHEMDPYGPDEERPSPMWVVPGCPAAGLLVYYLVKALGAAIDREMADNLYTAISTDTGSFRYDNTTAGSLEAAAELVRAGAEPALVARNVYETWSASRMRLLCLALDTIELRDGTAIMSVSQDMFRSSGAGSEDVDNFTGFPRMLKDAKVAVLVSELADGTLRASLRAKGDADVRRVAQKFGGGGHKRAAGFRTTAWKGNIQGLRETLFKEIAGAIPKEG